MLLRAHASATPWHWTRHFQGDIDMTMKNRLDVRIQQMQNLLAVSKELSTRISALPRELRDMIYEEIWEVKGGLGLDHGIKAMLPESHSPHRWLPGRCFQTVRPISLCSCSMHLPHFVQSRFVGKAMADEMLSTLRRIIRVHGASHEQYKYDLDWNTMNRFQTPDIFHLGISLHSLFDKLHLRVHFHHLNLIENDQYLDMLGISGGFKARLAGCVRSLEMLCDHGPRRITFIFKETTWARSSVAASLFRGLSAVFHKLKGLGFDMRVEFAANYTQSWILSAKEWTAGPEPDPSTWDLAAWNLNFTRTNLEYLAPRTPRPSGVIWVHNPNGPMGPRFLEKAVVWESIRRNLYQFRPEVDQAVRLRHNEAGQAFVDCGCNLEAHTCSPYYCCHDHGGWDEEYIGGNRSWNKYCYKCAEAGLKPKGWFQ